MKKILAILVLAVLPVFADTADAVTVPVTQETVSSRKPVRRRFHGRMPGRNRNRFRHTDPVRTNIVIDAQR